MKRSLRPVQRINDCSLAEAKVSQLNQRLHYLIQVIQRLTVARDLNTIMAVVRTGARQLTGADGATFVLRDGDFCYYADEDAISPLWKGGRFPMSACISGWVMLNQQSVTIADIYADPRIPAEAYRPTFVKSLAMVPIRTRDPIGAIGNYWATHHALTDEELNLLQTLADAAAVAIENVYLYQEQEHRIRERTAQLQKALDFEALLKRITDNVRDRLDERQIITTVVQELTQGLALSCCNTTFYDLDYALEPYTATDDRAQIHAAGCDQCLCSVLTVNCHSAAAMSEFSELYVQLLHGATFQFCRIPQPDLLPAAAASIVLICPIVDEQRVLGNIWLSRTSTEVFTELEVRLVQQVANQCAIALRQVRLRKALQSQVTELERLNQLKDDFLSTVSHELRTPMTNIKMAVQMLKTRLGVMNLDAQLAPSSDVVINQDNFLKTISYLKILSHECQRETNLINDLLDLTRLEAETTPGLLQEVALQQWIPHIANSFRERMQQQQQHLHVSIPEQLPSLRTNLTVLERILTELLQNACKYTPTGESITISVTTCEPEQYASGLPSLGPSFLLTVSNSGVEISDSDRASIFDKFYRIPNGDPWKNGGTGLGLALVKRLVEQLSGSIAVDSYDNSVRFIVKLIHLS